MHAAHEEAAEGVGATFPVLTTALDTYDAVTAIAQIQPSIRPTSKAKIQEAKVGSPWMRPA
jgi:BioD-like phosphotransacetylase family protein